MSGRNRTPRSLLNQAMEMARAKFDSENQEKRAREQINLEKKKIRFDFINQSISPLFLLIAKYTLGYIVILLFIYFLGRMLLKKKRRPNQKPQRRTATQAQQRGRLDLNLTNPYKSVEEYAFERPLLGAGRTDQILYFDPTGGYKEHLNSLAVSTKQPKPITWNIDPTRTDSFQKLPAHLIKQIQNSPKLEVTIPWKNNGYYWVPDCSAATYKDGSSAAELLKDQGGSCVLAAGASTSYASRLRPHSRTSVDQFASQKEPRC